MARIGPAVVLILWRHSQSFLLRASTNNIYARISIGAPPRRANNSFPLIAAFNNKGCDHYYDNSDNRTRSNPGHDGRMSALLDNYAIGITKIDRP